MIELDTIHHADLLTLCGMCEPQSIDMILCDLPYGTTHCAWDKVIPFEPMWEQFKRVIKPRGAIVLTASQPFASLLATSNLDMFRYDLIWEKPRPTQFPNANRRPLSAHEIVLVFSMLPANGGVPEDQCVNYFPQMETGKPYVKRNAGSYGGYGSMERADVINAGVRYPRSVLKIDNSNHGNVHPTQKPVALFEYLIRTYTQAGDVVLDPCAGSGTTAIAARNTERHYIVGDISEKYVEIIRKRLAEPYTSAMFSDTAFTTPHEFDQQEFGL